MEAKSKGECIELAIDSLMQLQEHYVEAVDWIEKSKAFVPDESKTVQELKAALAKSIERETELERRLAASSARERRLTTYIGGLSKMASEAESILEDVRNIGMIIPTQEEGSTPWGQVRDNSPEACCGNYEECDKQCVPLANHWRNRAREAEKAETKAPTHHPSPHLD